MPIQTTCIGAFPKPEYVPIRDWFQVDHGDADYQEKVVDQWNDSPENEALFQRATREVIKAQVACGVDVPTDGEIRRENYVHYQCRQFSGFDFSKLERRVLRNGAYESVLPAIRGPVEAGNPVLPRDYKLAQAGCDRPVKITLPGPLTIMDTTADCFYDDDRRLALDLANALNKEVLALAAAGCRYIQVDEPVFARKPDAALEYGVEMLERIFHGVPEHVERTSHMCCGYPDKLDNPDYPKADHNTYHQLVEALDGRIDALSIEDCHCGNDLSLFEKFRKTKAIVGFVDISTSHIEPVAAIRARMQELLEILPPERLIAAPDCGLGLLGTELSLTKLTNMCLAAARV